MTEKSLCCGANVMPLYKETHYKCLGCGAFCDLQKNEDLTLAEVYAVKDDVISFTSKQLPKDSVVKSFSGGSLDLGAMELLWFLKDWRYTITDRHSWHRHEDIKKIHDKTGLTDIVNEAIRKTNQEAVDKYFNPQWVVPLDKIKSKEAEHSHKDDDIRLSIAEAVQSKEIKIGDTLTAEEAQKYIEAGGFVDCNGLIYKVLNKKREMYYWDDGQSDKWVLSSWYGFNGDLSFTAVENPEKQEQRAWKEVSVTQEINKIYVDDELKKQIDRLKKDLADEEIKVKELSENGYGLKKEIEELRRKNRSLVESGKTITELADKQVADLKSQLEAERKKSEWLPYPENKPSIHGKLLVKDEFDQKELVFYDMFDEYFELSNCKVKIDKSTIKFFREV